MQCVNPLRAVRRPNRAESWRSDSRFPNQAIQRFGDLLYNRLHLDGGGWRGLWHGCGPARIRVEVGPQRVAKGRAGRQQLIDWAEAVFEACGPAHKPAGGPCVGPRI
jgi:hypothetical protein